MSAGFDQLEGTESGQISVHSKSPATPTTPARSSPPSAQARKRNGRLQKKNVRLVAEEASENENTPSHRVFAAKTEIGACRQKSFKEGRDYLSMTLDDPSFTAPIFASLFADEDGKTFNLIWSRARILNGHRPPHPSPVWHCRAGLCGFETSVAEGLFARGFTLSRRSENH